MRRISLLAMVFAASTLQALALRAQTTDTSSLASQVLVASGMDSTAQAELEKTSHRLSADPALALYQGIVTAWRTKYFSWNTFRPAVLKVYESSFAPDDLRQLLALYQTPLGRKIVAARSLMSATLTPLLIAQERDHMPELLAAIREAKAARATIPPDSSHH